jgi:hypothetical protein
VTKYKPLIVLEGQHAVDLSTVRVVFDPAGQPYASIAVREQPMRADPPRVVVRLVPFEAEGKK